jgi:hypothetical protein
MVQENRISLKIPQETLTEVQNAIKVLQVKLLPLLITLSVEERSTLTKMGDKNAMFIRKCKEYMDQNPGLTPQFIDLKEMQVDLDAVEVLRTLSNPVAQISSAIDDSMMLSGSEAYIAALAFYHNVKGADRMNVPGAKTIYEELKKQFAKKSNNIIDISKTEP